MQTEFNVYALDELIENKKKDIDCDDEGSAKIKMWIKRSFDSLFPERDKYLSVMEELEYLFPCEVGEAYEEYENRNNS